MAGPRNVVVFTFHYGHPHAANGGKVHRNGVLHFTFRQCLFDKRGIDCLQKEFGGQVHDRSVFTESFRCESRKAAGIEFVGSPADRPGICFVLPRRRAE